MSQQDTTQAKFRKSPKKESEQPQIEENEVRIKGNLGNVKRYVEYACGLLQKEEKPEKDANDEEKENEVNGNNDNNDGIDNNKDDDKPKEKDDNENDAKDNDGDDKELNKKKITKQFKTIVLKATGRAINKAVTTAEVVKRRVAGLHQDTRLETLEIVDVWEPLEEGLKQVETTRRVASITIKLSLDPEEIEKMKENTGYQQPLSSDAIKTSDYSARRSNTYRGNNRRGGGYRRGGSSRRGSGGYNSSYRNNYYGSSSYSNRRGGYGGSRRGGYNSNYYNGGGSRGGYGGGRYRGNTSSYNRYRGY